ncbi:hypothetical protein ACFQ3B_07685 [Stackebrandtia endophytica]|uniref:hypothetical protein n=1 Tax=Stackebrandtia endophytica TaxID=1496996 RepID=UPI001153CF8E|nr:hypothetical protein [Stackebrandtia endophytica]
MNTVRSVLFVCRTIQSTARLLFDVMPLLVEDSRIQVLFTVDESSAFGDGVPRLLDHEQVKLIPWSVATGGRFDCDVTVSASANRSLALLPGRKLVMAHGAGAHKYRVSVDGTEEAVSSLSPKQLMVGDELLPSTITLAGPDQLQRLADSCPAAVPAAEVVGDVCAERMELSLPHRARYRHHLGVAPEQRLIVLSSTWGPDSLLSRDPTLSTRLLSRLPANEYQLAFVLNPNGWDKHSRPNVHGWQETAIRAGMRMIPPHEGWRATVVASDLAIVDHGSVGFYAAHLGRPLLFGTFSDSEVPVNSPMARLAAAAPFIDPDTDLVSQIESACRNHDPGRYRTITESALDPTGSAGERMRAVLYRLLDLDPMSTAYPPRPLPLPDVDHSPATACHVYPVVSDGVPTMIKFPITTTHAARGRPYRDRILVVDAAEPDEHQRHSASVITWTESGLSVREASHWIDEQLTSYPGTSVFAARLLDERIMVRSRGHGRFLIGSDSRLDIAVVAAAARQILLETDSLTSLTLRDGRRIIDLNIKGLVD